MIGFPRTLFTFLLLFCLCADSISQSISVPLLQDKEITIQGPRIEYLEDRSKYLSIQDVTSPEMMEQYLPIEAGVPNMGFTHSSLWFRFSLTNKNDQPLSRVLEIKNPNIDLLQLFEFSQGKINQLAIGGDYFNFDQRERKHHNFQFNITLPAGKQMTYYLRIDNNGEQLHVPIALWDEKSLSRRDYKEQYLFGIYYGIVIFVFLLNLFMYVIIKEQSNLYYLLYVLTLGLLQLALSGYAFEFIWPGSTYLANHSLPFLASTSVFFLLLFTTTFLNTAEILPRAHIVLKIFTVVVFVNVLLSVIQDPVYLQLSIITINTVTLSLNFIIIPVAILAIREGFKPAKFFVTAFIVLIFGVFAFVLKNFGLAPSTWYTEYGLQIGSSLEVILLSFAIVDKFKRFRDDSLHRLQEMNELKDQINVRLEKEVKERTSEINLQKEELAEKNESITSSIKYASRIQLAILPPASQVQKLLPDSFIYYLAKDIVSGDFYWLEQDNEDVYIAAVDCTGHGVPGAMMSVIGYNALNKALKTERLSSPADILNSLNETVAGSLRKWKEQEIADGMDLALCKIDFSKKKVSYAGAYNPLYIIKETTEQNDLDHFIFNGYQLLEVKADKHPIGSTHEEKYKEHEFYLNKNEGIFIFSDGYADQFGGEKGKKFKYKAFKQLLLKNYHLPMEEQQMNLNKEYLKWKGKLEQVDDICVIGIKL